MGIINILIGFKEGKQSIILTVEVRLFGLLLKKEKQQYWKQYEKSLSTQAPKKSQDNNIHIIKPKSLDAERKEKGVRQ